MACQGSKSSIDENKVLIEKTCKSHVSRTFLQGAGMF